MNFEEFKEYFNIKLKENNINNKFDEEQFFEYMRNILSWNEKINLTNIIDEREFIVKHFIDSLTILDYIQENSKIIDIGCGAGFPGIPLKIAKKNINETLIDSANKKVKVVQDSIEKLKLENIEALHVRAEDLARNKKYREQFDYSTTRAVSNLSTITEYMLPFLKIGGKAICMKGPNYKEELENSKKAINVLGGTIEKIKNIKLDDNMERNIIIIKKIKSTPNQYPRENGKPLKSPIQ
ncbi:MAG: 16S rRNA (guanine(527)-N(7))-methyltransferase RsmG [Candidatus Scatovivens sp.]